MLNEKMMRVGEKPVLRHILQFFDGNYYPLIYAVLVLVCSFAGFELALFAVTAAIILFTTLFSKDTKSLIVPLVLVVYGMSQRHTPQPPFSSDYLNRPYFLITTGCLLALVFAATIFRMIAYKGQGNVFKTRTKARWGLFAMGAVLVLNGVFYSGYTIANLICGIAIAL